MLLMNFEDIKKGRRHLARALIQYAEMLREQIDGLTHTFYSGAGPQAWWRTSSVNENAAEKRDLCGKLGTMRILGIDCGTECTGYGVVEIDSRDSLCCISFGGIKLSRAVPLPQRLATIFDELTAAIDEHQPDQV